jgi:hypothetical protein
MNPMAGAENRAFWGLFLALALASAAAQIQYSYVFIQYRELGFATVGTLSGITRPICLVCALLLAWMAIRTKTVRVLVIFAALATLAALAPFVSFISGEVSIVLLLFFIPLLGGLLLLLLPASIAGGHGGHQALLVGFGMAWVLSMLLALAAVEAAGALTERIGIATGHWLVIGLLLLAIVSLLPIKPELFTIDPPERGRLLAPVERGPVVTALLSWVVPFYLLYWIYRVHGEEASLKPSRQLLSPRAAAWIVVIPVVGNLMLPILFSTLADHHNEIAAESGMPRLQRPWAVFFCTLFCLPVAVGLLQSKLNRLAALRAASGELRPTEVPQT